jgi:hypothetical protein
MRHLPCSAGRTRAATLLLACTLAALGACGRKHHLSEHTFANRSMSLVYDAPPAPQLLTGIHSLRDIDDPVEAVMRASSGVAREVEGRKASARLDSATARVDLANRLAQKTLERASRYLGTRATSSSADADYLLEVHMRRFGLDVRYQSAAYLFTEAEAVLLDRRTGREIWSSEVRGTSRLTPFVRGSEHVPAGIITAGTLSTVSVQDFQEALDQLVGFSSMLITDELRGALRGVRR